LSPIIVGQRSRHWGVRLFDQIHLPRSSPLLDPFFPPNGFFDVVVYLEVNQAMNPVAFGEPFDEAAAMLPDSSDEVGCHSRIQGAVRLAGQDVEGGLFRHRGAFRGFPLPAFAGTSFSGMIPSPGEEGCVSHCHEPPPLPRAALKDVDSRFRGNDGSGRLSCGDQADLV
jgi:hypothetical protein